MVWVTWRQHRVEILVAALLLAAVAVPLIVTGMAMHRDYTAGGVAACVTDPSGHRGCAQVVDQFVQRHTEWANRLIWVLFLPALAGVFIGAPMLAREFEHGTWRLAFTQSVTRTRWLAAKLSITAVAVAAVAAGYAVLFSWWRAPLDEIGGRLHTSAFVVAAPSLVAVTLFAFAVGVIAGALLRRTIAAMAATLAAFVAVRVTMEEYARPYYLTPRVRVTDPALAADTGWRPDTDWTVAEHWVDASGRRLSEGEEREIVQQIYGDGTAVYGPGSPVERYLAEHGLRHYSEFHPNSGFWPMQAIESAWFLAFAAALLAAAVWIVRRRTT